MGLTTAQYNRIMHLYGQRQLNNHRLTEERRSTIYGKYPVLKELDDRITSLYARLARIRITQDPSGSYSLEEELTAAKAERLQLMKEASIREEDLLPVYTCPDCKDTGYIDHQPCHCFRQAAINEIYEQSNIRQVLRSENFSTLSYDYYSDTDIDPATGISSLDTARRAVAECHRFVDSFEDKPKNLLFYGSTGVGKTFLSNCVAKELLDAGKSVIYFTSFQLFDILSKGVFNKDAEAIETNREIFDCDLLIIDDLGTETPNSFTTSQLFLCVNERILRQRSTVISTNLNIRQLTELYSERTLSRIFSNYSIIRMFGDDIRTRQRTSRSGI